MYSAWLEGYGETTFPLAKTLAEETSRPGNVFVVDPETPSTTVFYLRINVLSHTHAIYFIRYTPSSQEALCLVVFPTRQRDLLPRMTEALALNEEPRQAKKFARDGWIEHIYKGQQVLTRYGLYWHT
jgi:hypothetical protein